MSHDRDIERILDRWFEEGPTEVADRVIVGALDVIDTTQQRHVLRVPRRYPSMNGLSKWAAAAVVVVAAGGLALVALQPNASPSAGGASPESPGLVSPSPFTPSTASPSPSTRAIAVAAGFRFTCAITAGGGVRCWGTNNHGQLGNGTTTDSSTPVDVSGLTSGVTAIALGYQHACALTSLGGVQCWGNGQGGQLGNDRPADSTIPVDVSGLTSGVTAIAAGGGWVCAPTSGGSVKCWGWNAAGQLGNGTTSNARTPVDVAGLAGGAAAIAGGGRHTCALTTTGGVKCFGHNANGALGDGSTTGSVSPVDVAGLTSGVTAIAAGDFYSCALLRAGGVKCWGDNRYGQLGNGTTTDSSIPVDVSGLATGVTAITATRGAFNATYHACALMTGGGVKCWGQNATGQLGNGTTTDSSIPVDVAGLAGGATAITTGGGGHSCALTDGGGIKCWGDNSSGQLGDGTTNGSTTPVNVSGL